MAGAALDPQERRHSITTTSIGTTATGGKRGKPYRKMPTVDARVSRGLFPTTMVQRQRHCQGYEQSIASRRAVFMQLMGPHCAGPTGCAAPSLDELENCGYRAKACSFKEMIDHQTTRPPINHDDRRQSAYSYESDTETQGLSPAPVEVVESRPSRKMPNSKSYKDKHKDNQVDVHIVEGSERYTIDERGDQGDQDSTWIRPYSSKASQRSEKENGNRRRNQDSTSIFVIPPSNSTSSNRSEEQSNLKGQPSSKSSRHTKKSYGQGNHNSTSSLEKTFTDYSQVLTEVPEITVTKKSIVKRHRSPSHSSADFNNYREDERSFIPPPKPLKSEVSFRSQHKSLNSTRPSIRTRNTLKSSQRSANQEMSMSLPSSPTMATTRFEQSRRPKHSWNTEEAGCSNDPEIKHMQQMYNEIQRERHGIFPGVPNFISKTVIDQMWGVR